MKLEVGRLNGPAVADSRENARNPSWVGMADPLLRCATGRDIGILCAMAISRHLS